MCKLYKVQTNVKTGLLFVGDRPAVDFAGFITLCIGSKSGCSCFCFIFNHFSMREIQERESRLFLFVVGEVKMEILISVSYYFERIMMYLIWTSISKQYSSLHLR